MRLIRKILAFPFFVVVFLTFCLSDILEWISGIVEAIAYAVEGKNCESISVYDTIETGNDPNDNFRYGG